MSSPPASDVLLSEWALRIRAGDLDAFEALFHRFHPMLTRVASSVAETSAEAEDAVQETFVRFWEQRERIDPDRSVPAYLIRSVRNRALNGVRDARTRRTLLDAHALDADPFVTPPDEAAAAASSAQRVRAFLAELPERQRTALSLTRFDGLSHAEAAEAMDCSVRTVNNHIVRGLQTLRERLQATDPDGF